jgi:hypothetical protein
MPGVSDDRAAARDLVAIWDYFRPDYAMGDAYGVGMLTAVNDDLFRKGLTHVNRETVADGQSTATAWSEWAFAPMRFEGMTKHVMASAVREAFHHNRAAFPYVDTMDEREPRNGWPLCARLGNMKALPTQASYSSFQMVDQQDWRRLVRCCLRRRVCPADPRPGRCAGRDPAAQGHAREFAGRRYGRRAGFAALNWDKT